jgi:hypothetical protein
LDCFNFIIKIAFFRGVNRRGKLLDLGHLSGGQGQQLLTAKGAKKTRKGRGEIPLRSWRCLGELCGQGLWFRRCRGLIN